MPKSYYFYLNFDQLMPAKKGCAFIYSTPLVPSLSLGSAINFLTKKNNYLIRSVAWGDTFAYRGITKYFFQFWILCQV